MSSPHEQNTTIGDLDVAQIDPQAVGRPNLTGGQLVADEQIVGDPLHLRKRSATPGCPTRSRTPGRRSVSVTTLE